DPRPSTPGLTRAHPPNPIETDAQQVFMPEKPAERQSRFLRTARARSSVTVELVWQCYERWQVTKPWLGW
ncbi:MAG: hypothetical protein FWG16_05795, partial [Micrococcales bacterium]|nr:hypothetical protein [Micrococcales bacterium]